MATYKAYPTKKTDRSRRVRKGLRNSVFAFNRKANKAVTK